MKAPLTKSRRTSNGQRWVCILIAYKIKDNFEYFLAAIKRSLNQPDNHLGKDNLEWRFAIL